MLVCTFESTSYKNIIMYVFCVCYFSYSCMTFYNRGKKKNISTKMKSLIETLMVSDSAFEYCRNLV